RIPFENRMTEPKAIPFYRDERFLSAAAQIVSALLVIAALWWLVVNFLRAAEARNLSLSFEFLDRPAGFPISDPAIPYSTSDTFGYAFLVGVLNTLRVAVSGIVAATILGTLVALARLSSNWLLSKIALAYIEFHRNIPLLVLLFIWYFTVFRELPAVGESIVFPGPIYLNQRGVYFTWPRLTETGGVFAAGIAIGLLAAVILWNVLRARRERTGKKSYFWQASLAALVVFPVLGWIFSGGQPLQLDVPSLQGFNIRDGLRLNPEFAALFVGLVTYTAAFIAEVVRGGIQAVDRGQIEAARALGLNGFQVLSFVVVPQAMRVIIPPMISQYLNLTKNSSLALAIGYQELFSVGRIAINQAGRAVPVFLLVMGTYLLISLVTAFVLNIYNRRIQFVTR
ncbi:MAG: amino acid ABC transporter permease, partial [Anaerolineales bacterium]